MSEAVEAMSTLAETRLPEHDAELRQRICSLELREEA
jgi:hypothetical protein